MHKAFKGKAINYCFQTARSTSFPVALEVCSERPDREPWTLQPPAANQTRQWSAATFIWSRHRRRAVLPSVRPVWLVSKTDTKRKAQLPVSMHSRSFGVRVGLGRELRESEGTPTKRARIHTTDTSRPPPHHLESEPGRAKSSRRGHVPRSGSRRQTSERDLRRVVRENRLWF